MCSDSDIIFFFFKSITQLNIQNVNTSGASTITSSKINSFSLQGEG